MNENYVTEVIEKTLKAGMIAFDIGANVGGFSKEMSVKCEKVYAFEPHPDNVKSLEENIKGLHNVTIIPKAVGIHTGKANLYVHGSPGCHTMRKEVPTITKWGHNASRYLEVDIISIDNFVKEENLSRLDFIKIDVEGAEEDVIRSAERTLKELRPSLIVEVHKEIDFDSLFNFITDLQYDIKDSNGPVTELLGDCHYFFTPRKTI